MRTALLGFSIGGLALLLVGTAAPAAAREGPGNAALIGLLPSQPGSKACYIRSYDAAHLRAHPDQSITAMTFLLRVPPHDPDEVKPAWPEDRVYFTFSMSASRRGDQRLLRAAGNCFGGDEIFCVVDCDGGGVTLDKMPPAGALAVRLRDAGIRMSRGCDDNEGVRVEPGADDRVFRLEKAANEACRALDQK